MKTLLLLALFAADPFAIPEDPYKVVGIKKPVVRVEKEENDLQRRIEGFTEKRTLRQRLQVDVTPGKEIRSDFTCRGNHIVSICDDAVQRCWFGKKDHAENRKKQVINRLRGENVEPPNIHWEGLKKTDDHYTYGGQYFHGSNNEKCYCRRYSPSREKPEPGDTVKKIRRCQGHSKTDKKGKTNDYKKEKKHLQQKNDSYNNRGLPHRLILGQSEYDRDIYHYEEWRHPDCPAESPNVHGCDNYFIDTVIVKPPVIKEKWVDAEDSQKIRAMETDSRCHLLRIEDLEGPKERIINGVKVSRSAWERDLVFECASEKSECSDKRSDFPEVMSMIAAAADLFTPMENSTLDENSEEPLVYPGASLSCRCNYRAEAVLNCCNTSKLDGQCSEQEKDLAKLRQQKRCHLVEGERRDAEGNSIQTYCCFSSKIARLMQEKAREKLSLSWGTAENPDCRPLTLKEIGDAGEIDLSDVHEDYQVDHKEWERKMEESLEKKLDEIRRRRG